MIPAPRNVGSFCICHSRRAPSGGFLNTLIHDREGFTPATNDRFTMYTFTTACNHAGCQQTVYIKKEGKNHSQRKKSWVFVRVSGHTLGFHPLPYTTLSRHSMASKRAGWFLLSISTQICFTRVLVTTCQEPQRAWRSCPRCFLLEKGPSSFF